MHKIKDTTWIELELMTNEDRRQLEDDYLRVDIDCDRWEFEEQEKTNRGHYGYRQAMIHFGRRSLYDLKWWLKHDVNGAARKLKQRFDHNRAEKSTNRYFERKAKRLEKMGYKVLRDEHGNPKRQTKEVTTYDSFQFETGIKWKTEKEEIWAVATEPHCDRYDQPSGSGWFDNIKFYFTGSYGFWDLGRKWDQMWNRIWDRFFDFMGNHEILSAFILVFMFTIPIGLIAGFLIYILPLIITGNFSIAVAFEVIERWFFYTFLL